MSNLNQSTSGKETSIWNQSDAKPRHYACSRPTPTQVMEHKGQESPGFPDWIRECSTQPFCLVQTWARYTHCAGTVSSVMGGYPVSQLSIHPSWRGCHPLPHSPHMHGVNHPPHAKHCAGCWNIRMKWHRAYSQRVHELRNETNEISHTNLGDVYSNGGKSQTSWEGEKGHLKSA